VGVYGKRRVCVCGKSFVMGVWVLFVGGGGVKSVVGLLFGGVWEDEGGGGSASVGGGLCLGVGRLVVGSGGGGDVWGGG